MNTVKYNHHYKNLLSINIQHCQILSSLSNPIKTVKYYINTVNDISTLSNSINIAKPYQHCHLPSTLSNTINTDKYYQHFKYYQHRQILSTLSTLPTLVNTINTVNTTNTDKKYEHCQYYQQCRYYQHCKYYLHCQYIGDYQHCQTTTLFSVVLL